MAIPINLVYEDELSEFVLSKLINSFKDKYHIGYSYNGRGFGYIKNRISGFNNACIATPYLVLVDLDNNPCAVTLKNEWLNFEQHPNLIFRVAVREVESWLLADIEGFSGYTGVSQANFPDNPDLEIDPKSTLINIARRSRKRFIREDIIPINNNARIGPNYNGRLMEFVFEYWNIVRAMERSDSLKRAYRKLELFQYHLPN